MVEQKDMPFLSVLTVPAGRASLLKFAELLLGVWFGSNNFASRIFDRLDQGAAI
jgi:hypothetical protein